MQHCVHTAMVPDLQLELSASRCQVPGYTTFRFLRVDKVCVSVGFFMCASMPHKELTFFPLSASPVTGLLNTFTTISNSPPLQSLCNLSRVEGCFLSASTLWRDKRGVFSSFMLWLLCPVNPLDCNYLCIILTLAPASACTMPAAIPTACKIHTDGPLHILFVKCSRPPDVYCHKLSWEWFQYVRSYRSPLGDRAVSAMQTIGPSLL